MFNLRTLLFGVIFGLLDATGLPVVKAVSNGMLSIKWMILPFLLYASSPFIFLKGLQGETLTILNLVWDLSSDLIITVIGLFFFGETIGYTKALGVCLSFVSLFLMSYESEAFENALAGGMRRVKEAFTFKQ